MPLYSLISQYNVTELPAGPDRMSQLMGLLLVKRIKMHGFIVFDDYSHRYNEFTQAMGQWLAQGKIQYREDNVIGLKQAASAFIGLLQDENFGKLVVEMSPIDLIK